MSTEIERKIDEYIVSHRHLQINSVLVYKDGRILAGRYYNGFNENSKHVIMSVAKSIMSVCMGIADDDIGNFLEWRDTLSLSDDEAVEKIR